MAHRMSTVGLEAALAQQGLIPTNCHLLEVVMKPNSVLSVRYEVFLTGDDLLKFAKAFQSVAEANAPEIKVPA
jgi:hypothetical protein